MYEFFRTLDRRWVFLTMLVAVVVPILAGWRFPEKPTDHTKNAFAEIEKLPLGSRVLLSFDFDPASAGELAPMATAFTYHCAARGHKLYFTALWPVGPQMIEDAVNRVLKVDFPHYEYGRDYVNLGFKSGNESVIKVIITDLRKLYTTDARGTGFGDIPMMQDVVSVQDMDLVISVSAGYSGAKEWVQYAKTAHPDAFNFIAGCTGVQAQPLLPYIPSQMAGLVAAIKGAAEYETLLVSQYNLSDNEKYQEGIRRMGPQLTAHVLMVLLIIAGNLIFLAGRSKGVRS